MQTDPKKILPGAVPRLFDEWQEYPDIWNYVRREVDKRRENGQFILTGSSMPVDDVRRHSGVGRFSILRMRPMSLFERRWSTGEVRLSSLFAGVAPKSDSVEFSFEDLAEKIAMGGWPVLIGSDVNEGLRRSRVTIDLIADIDLSRVSDKRRDPKKIRQLLRSIARNISTEAGSTTLAKDTVGADPDLRIETVLDYLDALERLHIVEDLPAWSTHIRSKDTLRKAPKRHFVDPSLAVGALGLTTKKLLADISYLGLLFESLAIRDLRIYAESLDADIFHYRDSRGLEVDAIVELRDGTWMAFEIKLGLGAADDAAKNLLAFADRIDTKKVGKPTSLTVITANGFAHRRKDGVNVVPLSTLTA